MLNEQELNLLADIFQERFAEVSTKIIQDIGETLKKTGDLTPSQAKKLQQMYSYGFDLDRITNQLVNASGQSVKDIETLYQSVAQEESNWARPFFDAKGVKQIPLAENKALQNIIKSAAAVTSASLINISNTTTVGINTAKGFQDLGSFYRETVDNAITAVATGAEDYHNAIRRSVLDLGKNGLRVQYDSGYTKRLDSAVRQNVLDGASYVARGIARQNGEAFGADGVEISAHSPCAPDHLPYQGKQFSNEEFEQLQQSLKRPIGEWNCRHFAYPIVLGISHPANSKAELAEMQEYSNEKIEIDGQKYTRYECSQMQRQLETQMRYASDERLLYKTIGDDVLVRRANERIRILSNKYLEISEKAELPTKAERTRSAFSSMRNKASAKKPNYTIDVKISKKAEDFKNKLDAGEINSKLKWNKQREHIEGTKEHERRLRNDAENHKTPASYFYSNVDIAEVVKNNSGKGLILFRSEKQVYPDEYISLDKPIGKVYNVGKKRYEETRRIQIKYSKDGIHTFPIKENDKYV